MIINWIFSSNIVIKWIENKDIHCVVRFYKRKHTTMEKKSEEEQPNSELEQMHFQKALCELKQSWKGVLRESLYTSPFLYALPIFCRLLSLCSSFSPFVSRFDRSYFYQACGYMWYTFHVYVFETILSLNGIKCTHHTKMCIGLIYFWYLHFYRNNNISTL